MGYPRQCPCCDALYIPPIKGTATVERRVGGLADPRLPGRAGAVLHLSCLDCGSQFWWDFFAATLIPDLT
jgi:hypothetical protein